jgi:glycerophosphoryl diester phosphodiesterase
VEVLGHRGWPAAAHPENTLAAVEAAFVAGCSGVEVDVRLTADGEPVCAHDGDLLRVAGRASRIREIDDVALAAIRLPGGHAVPRLREVAASAAGRGRLVLDVKPDSRRELVADRIVMALGDDPAQDVVVSSARRSILEAVRARAPKLSQALISVPGNSTTSLLAAARDDGLDGVHLDVTAFLADPGVVAEAHDLGLVVRCWTVNRQADALLASVAGVDGVITDHPHRMLGTRPYADPSGAVSCRAPAFS